MNQRSMALSVGVLVSVFCLSASAVRLRNVDESLLPMALSKGEQQALLAKVGSHSESLREEGLEGSVGNVPFDTPTKLQDETLKLYMEVGAKIESFRPKPISEILSMLPHVEVNRIAKVPLIAYKMRILKKACPGATAKSVGDESNPDAYPRCLMRYMTNMDELAKKKLGSLTRELLGSEEELRNVFDSGGLCNPVAALLDLESDFCKRLLDVLISVPSFIAVSDEAELLEREHYGEEVVLLQMMDHSEPAVTAHSTELDPSSQLLPESVAASMEPHPQLHSLEIGPPASGDSMETGEIAPTASGGTVEFRPVLMERQPISQRLASAPQQPEGVPPTKLTPSVTQPPTAGHSRHTGAAAPPLVKTSGSGMTRKHKIQSLQLRISMKKIWNFLAISPLRSEANKLLEVWHNEPVHKWRYTVGIMKFIQSVGGALEYLRETELQDGASQGVAS